MLLLLQQCFLLAVYIVGCYWMLFSDEKTIRLSDFIFLRLIPAHKHFRLIFVLADCRQKRYQYNRLISYRAANHCINNVHECSKCSLPFVLSLKCSFRSLFRWLQHLIGCIDLTENPFDSTNSILCIWNSRKKSIDSYFTKCFEGSQNIRR